MRASLSLNGLWKFCPAFDEISADQRWMDPDFDPDNPEVKPKTEEAVGWVEENFEDNDWLDIPVPNTWNTAMEDLWSYEGHGWYRRTVAVPAAWEGKRVEFNSLGANYRAAVYVNGVFAGAHEGGYNPFAIPIHEYLRYGEDNLIAVDVDNIAMPERAPSGQYGWVNHGGLYRDVCLEMSDQVRIDDVTTETEIVLERVGIDVRVVVADESGGAFARTVDIALFDPSGNAVDIPEAFRSASISGQDGEGIVSFGFGVQDALLWSPDSPHLYDLRLTLKNGDVVTDEWSHRIGLRTVTVEGTKLLLNGKPIFLKGFCRHEYYDDTGRVHTDANAGKDMDLVKWCGGNTIRGHYGHHQRCYEMADERGIMNLVEVPLYMWGRPLCEADHPEALNAAKSQLAEMVKSWKNHPSIIIWSVSNENLNQAQSDDPEAITLAKTTADGNKELVAMAKKLDPTRPIIEVSNSWPGDPVHEVTDITAANVYIGGQIPRSDALPGMMEAFEEKIGKLFDEHPTKPTLVAEVGVWTVRGLMTDHPPGEIYQSKFMEHYMEHIQAHDEICGVCIWILADYDLHRRFLWAHEYRPAYGVFDMKRRPKMAAHTLRKIWKGDD
jgi:beta-glucuronidase